MAIARRNFLLGLGSFFAAPAIIRTPRLLMPIKPLRPCNVFGYDLGVNERSSIWLVTWGEESVLQMFPGQLECES